MVRKLPRTRWIEAILALVALVNLLFVLFDLSYLSVRDFYLQEFPTLITFYDPLRDHFRQIDLWFAGFFGIEFLGRTFYLSRRHRGVRWLDTMLWRWYDLLLLLPFWRWLRVIPVVVRLRQVGWLGLDRIQAQISRALAENIAGEITELVVVRTLSLTQRSIDQGAVARWLLEPHSYVKINSIDEIGAIRDRLLQLLIYQVLPHIQPEVEALLRHNLESALSQSSLYQVLQKVPTVGHLQANLAAQLASNLYQALYNTLTRTLEDSETNRLLGCLNQQVGESLRSALQQKQTLQEIQSLCSDLLEEVKLTYLQRSQEEDVEQTLEELDQLRFGS